MGCHNMTVAQLNAEHGVWKGIDNNAFHFNGI
jgi:hypothetical protein